MKDSEVQQHGRRKGLRPLNVITTFAASALRMTMLSTMQGFRFITSHHLIETLSRDLIQII